MNDTTPHKEKKGNKKRAKRAFYSLLVISITATVVCAGGLIRELYIQNQGSSYYASLLAENTSQLPGAPVEAENRDDSQAGITNQASPGSTDGQSAPRAPQTPPNLDTIQAKLPQVQAWIRGEGTTIDYPVVQGADNEYYLDHLPNSTKNKMGSIFLDYRNAADFSDQNSVIYGHHIKRGALFGALDNYKSQSFYNAHPVMVLYTPQQDYTVELIAGYVADASQEMLPLGFADAAAFESYVKEIRRRSRFVSTVEVSETDRLLSLCTCSYELDDARFILVGRLVER